MPRKSSNASLFKPASKTHKDFDATTANPGTAYRRCSRTVYPSSETKDYTAMKTLLIVLAVLWSTTANAFYTECTVTKETPLANRPNGSSDPRFSVVRKGDKVAFRDRYEDWWFVLHHINGDENSTGEYGWIHKSVLTDCQKRDGTP
jgi:hypothetical protein